MRELRHSPSHVRDFNRQFYCSGDEKWAFHFFVSVDRQKIWGSLTLNSHDTSLLTSATILAFDLFIVEMVQHRPDHWALPRDHPFACVTTMLQKRG